MPRSTDEKVVQLTLDNKQFNRASDETIDSLEKLKKTLEFEGAIDSFEEVEKGIKKVDFAPMSRGIENVSNQFSALNTIADAAIRNVTNNIINSGERMLKSLSIDQVTTGWGKYAEQTGAVQTIMAATAQQFENTEVQMQAVNDQLEKLTWFTDETSHKFNDMVNGIGKFTANNVKLDTSVKAMEGIAVWASLSGANANEAARAIYNLAQAVSVGSVKLIDWRSIENANMGTTEFKQTVIETAEELGTLIKVADGVWTTLDGKGSVSIANFTEDLQRGWFSSEVLLKSLEKYGGYADELNKFVEETGVLTATAMNIVDDYVDGTLDMGEAMKVTGLSAEELTDWLKKLGDEEYELGRRGLRAAQETKTFQEAIDYVKEAVSSGWATSFKYIFGDYLEAKEWWSEIAETMYDVFVVGGEIRNQVLSMWKDEGGRDDFLDGIRTLIENVMGLLDIFKDAWNEVWYGDDEEQQMENRANALLSLTSAFKGFAEAIKPTETTIENIKEVLKVIFNLMKTGSTIIRSVASGLKPLLNVLNNIGGSLLQIVSDVARIVNSGLENLLRSGRLQAITNFVTTVSTLLSGTLQIALVAIFGVLEKIISKIGDLYQQVQDAGGGIRGVITVLIDLIQTMWDSFLNGESIANKVVDGVLFIFKSLVGGVKTIIDTAIALLTGEMNLEDLFGGTASDITEKFSNMLKSLNLEDTIGKIQQWVSNFISELSGADVTISNFIINIANAIGFLYEKLKWLIDELSVEDIKDFLIIIILFNFVNSLKTLNKSFAGVANAFSGTVNTFNNILKTLGGQTPVIDKINNIFAKTTFLQLAIAVAVIVDALSELNKLDYKKTQQSVAAMITVVLLLVGALKAIQKVMLSMPKKETKTDPSAIFNTFAKTILSVSVSVLFIAKAAQTIVDAVYGENGFEIGRVITALSGVVLIMGALVGAAKAMENIKLKSSAATFGSVIALTVGVNLLVNAVRALATIKDWKRLLTACAGVSAVILSLGGAVALMKNVDWKTALSMIPLVVSFTFSVITVMTAIAVLASVDWKDIDTAITATIVSIVGIAGALVILGNGLKGVKPKTIQSISVALIAFSASIVLLASALKMIEKVSFEETKAGLIALGASVGVMVVALGGLSILLDKLGVQEQMILSVGAAFVEFGAAVLILAASLKVIQGIKWDDIKAGVAVLGGAAAVFGVVLAVMAVLTNIMPISGPIIAKSMDIMGNAFMKFAAAVAILSAGIFALSAASALFATIIAALQTFASYFGVDLPSLISTGFDTLEIIIREFLEMLRNLAPDFMLTFASLFSTIILAIEAIKHPTAAAIAAVIVTVADEIANHGQDIVDALTKIINFINAADELFEALGDLFYTLGHFAGEAFVKALGGALVGMVEGVFDMVGLEFRTNEEQLTKHYTDTLSNAMNQLDSSRVAPAAKASVFKTMQEIITAWTEGQVDLDDTMIDSALLSMKAFSDTAAGQAYGATGDIVNQLQAGVEAHKKELEKVGETAGPPIEKGFGQGLDPDKPYDFFFDVFGKEIIPQLMNGVIDSEGNLTEIGRMIGQFIGLGTEEEMKELFNKYIKNGLFAGFGGKSGLTNAGVANGDLGYVDLSKLSGKERAKYLAAQRNATTSQSTESDLSEWEKYMESVGELGAKSLANGVSSPSSRAATSKAAKSQAQTISDAFSEEIDKLSRDQKLQDKLYKLWRAQNPNASEMEKTAQEIAYQSELVRIKTEEASISQKIYQQTLEAMGESAKETDEAYLAMLDDQIELLEAQNKLSELQNGTSENTVEAFTKFSDVVRTMDVNYLLEQGFNTQQIAEAAAKMAGVTMPKAVEEAQGNAEDAVTNAAKGTVDAYTNAVTTQISSPESIAAFKASGGSVATNVSAGMTESAYLIDNAASNLNTKALGTLNNEEVFNGYVTSGHQAPMGYAQGVDENQEKATTATTEMADAVVSSANEALEITKENGSGKFFEIGYQVDIGLIKGMQSGIPEVTAAAEEIAAAALAAAMKRLKIHSPSRVMYEVGKNYDLGFANGIDNYGDKVEKSAAKMIYRANKKLSKSDLVDLSAFSSIKEDLGLSDDLEIIINADEAAEKLKNIISGEIQDTEDYYDRRNQREKRGLDPFDSDYIRSGDPKRTGAAQLGQLMEEQTLVHANNKTSELLLEKLMALIAKANYTMEEKWRENEVDEKSEEKRNAETIVNLTQNNYSPTALSRVDIYRDTQKMTRTIARAIAEPSRKR